MRCDMSKGLVRTSSLRVGVLDATAEHAQHLLDPHNLSCQLEFEGKEIV